MELKKSYKHKHIDEETGKEVITELNYLIILRDNRIESIYNTVFGDWGHKIDENSEVFEYFKKELGK